MDVTLTESERIMKAGIAKAEELNIKISVAVCDSGGHLPAFNRMDGTIWITVYRSPGKAIAAAAYGRSTSVLTRARQSPIFPAVNALEGGHLIPDPGGMPLFRNGELIGAAGVSGGSDEEDELCAQAAVEAL